MTSRWRIAATSGLLAVGVLAFTGPVAHADTGSSSTAGGSSTEHESVTKPSLTSNLNDVVRSTLRGTANAVGLGQGPGASTRPTSKFGSTPLTTGLNDVTTSLTGLTKASASALENTVDAATKITRTVTGSIGPRPAPATSDAAPGPVVPDLAGPVVDAIAPTVDAFNATVNGVAQTALAPAGNLAQPVTDVIASTLPVLTAPVAFIGPLVEIPSHVASILVSGGVPLLGAGIDAGTPTPVKGGTVASPVRIVNLLAAPPVAAAGDPAAVPMPPQPVAAPLDLAAALGHTSAMSANDSVATADAAGPGATRSVLETVGGVVAVAVAAASLAALIAGALPGLIGMMLPTAAGAHLGYRQAKARNAIRSPGVARFAMAGPVGIVRSGGLVALRPSASRAVRGRVDRTSSMQEVA